MKKVLIILILHLPLLFACIRSHQTAIVLNESSSERNMVDETPADNDTLPAPRWITIENDDDEYNGLSIYAEDYELLMQMRADKHTQDSLSAILSKRLGKRMKMKNVLNNTYTDGKEVWYWNDAWGDAVQIPDGSYVDTHINSAWQTPNGACIHKQVEGGEVTIFVYAQYQVAYMTDEEFIDYAAEADIRDRCVSEATCSYLYDTIKYRDGTTYEYVYYIYDGKKKDTNQGVWAKGVRSIPYPEHSLYDITVYYPWPKTPEIEHIIKTVSSYPNITKLL